jgi:hypothetical protein
MSRRDGKDTRSLGQKLRGSKLDLRAKCTRTAEKSYLFARAASSKDVSVRSILPRAKLDFDASRKIDYDRMPSTTFVRQRLPTVRLQWKALAFHPKEEAAGDDHDASHFDVACLKGCPDQLENIALKQARKIGPDVKLPRASEESGRNCIVDLPGNS